MVGPRLSGLRTLPRLRQAIRGTGALDKLEPRSMAGVAKKDDMFPARIAAPRLRTPPHPSSAPRIRFRDEL